MVVMPSVAAIIGDEEGRVLLELKHQGGYMLPGGAVDPGESPPEAIVREVQEETGLAVEPLGVAAVVGPHLVQYENGDVVEYTGTIFRCRVTGGTLAPVDGEVAGFAWLKPDAIPDLGYPRGLWQWEPGQPALF